VSNVDLVNLIAAVASLVLSVVAIWLAFAFYRMSVRQADKAEVASAAISSSVDRLEKLFELMYADTFSMMKDTVTDMRGQLWKYTQPEAAQNAEAAAGQAADERIKELETQLLTEISAVSARLGVTSADLQRFRQEVSPVLSDALQESRHVEAAAVDARFRSTLLRTYLSLSNENPVKALDVVARLRLQGWSLYRISTNLAQLKGEGIASWSPEGPVGSIKPSTELSLDIGALEAGLRADRSG
jgi:hypothetical protein